MKQWLSDRAYPTLRTLLPMLGLFSADTLCAQLPESDVWLFNISKKDNHYQVVDPLNITNRPGYDNQPVFTGDGKSILYVSIRSDGQADVYRYDIKSKLQTNLTKSKVSEYSPTILPDESGFSAVVVEADSAQRIWNMSFDGSFMRFASDVTDSVGYHAWYNADTLLYYKLTEPHSLHALDLKSGKDAWICDHPSRAFRKVEGRSVFIYAVKRGASIEFRLYKPATRQSVVYATYASANEDFLWNAEFGLVKSENADLLRFNESNGQWETLFSLAGTGINKITRFAFDAKNKRLVVVNNQ